MSSWDQIDALKYRDEGEALRDLLSRPVFAPADRAMVMADALALVEAVRAAPRRSGVIEGFLQEFSLGTQEGLALMCLAEALLRTPDNRTRDRLIAEKIGSANWARHIGKSDQLFVNASTWGLMLTGKLVEIDQDAQGDPGDFIKALATKLGEPVIRKAVAKAISIMGDQFVLGGSIEAALARAAREAMLCSFDMLGEGARTVADAERYEQLYAHAIAAVGAHRAGLGPEQGHGVSVKLSALSPRYEALQEARVWNELYPRLRRVALIAAEHDLNLAIDAEEADRLTLSLKLVDKLAREPALGQWTGLGVVVQAYQKRAPEVIGRLDRLAGDSGRRLTVRLVKGAYWDAEIKRAQLAGRPDYPVWTTKAATDLAYLCCAKALIAAAPRLYPQFATHNAHTLCAVRRLADLAGVGIEHQRLHGMGEALYAAAAKTFGPMVVRAYAPVGGHDDLLPYLVRRLLENGANTSFVHSLLDQRLPASAVVADPIAEAEANPRPHPRIPTPPKLYGSLRLNSTGEDLTIATEARGLSAAVRAFQCNRLTADPIIGGVARKGAPEHLVRSPTTNAVLGVASDTLPDQIDEAFRRALRAQPGWDGLGGEARAAVLNAMAEGLDRHRRQLIAALVTEAGKTYADAIAEVREAIDFCRYYAAEARRLFAAPQALKGPVGETNALELHGRGVFACISPWNFPLSIFTGQVAAALAAGNAVIAKPAEQTPLIAALAVRTFHAAGLPADVLALVPGPGSVVGALLTNHPDLGGVAFTGGTRTARSINKALAERPGPIVPFIAETGGLNGMFIDTTALREQVIDDVVLSAFGSAGQRCSALRVLFLPNATADALIEGLKGAMDCLVVADPAELDTDVGPIIAEAARDRLEAHLRRLKAEAKVLHRTSAKASSTSGAFFAPTLAEIDRPDFLTEEVFGPILHVCRYDPDRLEPVARAFAARGYGLTLGVHSRLDEFARRVRQLAPAGNLYVNRSIIGAVVGVQPFGGEGLSGTGPKAGGPYSLFRYAVERAVSVNIAAQGGDPALFDL